MSDRDVSKYRRIGIWTLIYGIIVVGLLGALSEFATSYEAALNIQYGLVPRVFFNLCLSTKFIAWLVSVLTIVIGSIFIVRHKIKGKTIVLFGIRLFFVQLLLLVLFMVLWSINDQWVQLGDSWFLLMGLLLNTVLYKILKQTEAPLD